jgi:RNA polymerase sporulation-specific sigma factor
MKQIGCDYMDHTKELIERAHKGDEKARELLVTENMGLIGSIIKRFMGRGCEQEDLFQIGSIGLIKAVDKFDTSFDVKFSTYAVPMITGEIKRFLRDDGMIKVSRSLKENAVKIARAIEEYKKEHLKEPTIEEIAEMTDISTEDIVMSFEASADVESIYKTVYQSDENEICLLDRLEEKRNYNDEMVDKMVIGEILEQLPEKEQKLIRMRYFEERTQTDIAGELGISQVQVSRMEKRILANMKKKLA